MGKQPKKRYGRARPANDTAKAGLEARFAEAGLGAPRFVCASLLWRLPTAGQRTEYIAHTAASWAAAPREMVDVGDGLVGVRAKSTRQGRARWYGVIHSVHAWDRGEPRDPRQPRGRRDVDGPWQPPAVVVDLVEGEGLRNHDGSPIDLFARVILLWRISLLEEGDLATLTIPTRHLGGWHL